MNQPLVLNDRYELVERLGAGGTGEVFRAVDRRLDRVVAVKLLRPDAVGEEAQARMVAEARAAGGLAHRCIALVLDHDVTDEPEPRPFIVMEHVEGTTLSRLLREEGPLAPERVMKVVADVASALHVAHVAGVIHRDVKPGNIIIDEDDRAVLVDFGIARTPTSEPLTSTGSILGTADYLSPEQATGRSASAQSDLYALGTVAFACLMGHPPFPRENDVATALAHVAEPLPALDGIPSAIADLVRRLTAKNPDDRPRSAAEVEVEAGRLAGSGTWAPVDVDAPTGRLDILPLPQHSAAAPRRSRRTRLVALPAAGVVGAAAVVLALLPGAPTIPSVVGMQVGEAVAVLAEDDIDVRRTLVDEPGVEAGSVLAQSPEPGTRDDVVELRVASGKVDLTEEDVVGSTIEEATATLTKMGLAVTVERRSSAAKEPGTVLAVDRTGRLQVGSEVELTVAKAPPVVAPTTTGTAGSSTGSTGGSSSGSKSTGTGSSDGKAKGASKGKGGKK